MKSVLKQVFDDVIEVGIIDSGDAARLKLLSRPDLGLTFTKLHCWLLDQYEKCVFLDADTLVMQNVDDLFNREELSASPDAGWPDCFNSGVFVYRPSRVTFDALVEFALTHGSFDGGDQGLLNMFFKDWATDSAKRLPFTYNVVSQAFYSYLPAFLWFNKDIKIVHFIGAVKPWHHAYERTLRRVQEQPATGHNAVYLQLWWDIFTRDVEVLFGTEGEPLKDIGTITGRLFVHGSGDIDRQVSWEEGRADYLGADSFSSIESRIEETIKNGGNK